MIGEFYLGIAGLKLGDNALPGLASIRRPVQGRTRPDVKSSILIKKKYIVYTLVIRLFGSNVNIPGSSAVFRFRHDSRIAHRISHAGGWKIESPNVTALVLG